MRVDSPMVSQKPTIAVGIKHVTYCLSKIFIEMTVRILRPVHCSGTHLF